MVNNSGPRAKGIGRQPAAGGSLPVFAGSGRLWGPAPPGSWVEFSADLGARGRFEMPEDHSGDPRLAVWRNDLFRGPPVQIISHLRRIGVLTLRHKPVPVPRRATQRPLSPEG